MAPTTKSLLQRVEEGRERLDEAEVSRLRAEAMDQIERGILSKEEGDRIITEIVRKGGKLGEGYGVEGGGRKG